eukprot:6172862-Pleurochrysis_carterae.AAC.3
MNKLRTLATPYAQARLGLNALAHRVQSERGQGGSGRAGSHLHCVVLAQIVAGTPLRMQFERQSSAFVFEYVANNASSVQSRTTELHMAAEIQYEDGFHVFLSAGERLRTQRRRGLERESRRAGIKERRVQQTEMLKVL